MQGRPLQGVGVAFIELESGNVVRAISGSNGGFEAKAAPGQYAVTTESQAGLAIGQLSDLTNQFIRIIRPNPPAKP